MTINLLLYSLAAGAVEAVSLYYILRVLAVQDKRYMGVPICNSRTVNQVKMFFVVTAIVGTTFAGVMNGWPHFLAGAISWTLGIGGGSWAFRRSNIKEKVVVR